MKLTDAQVKKYVESGGNHCPVCGSENISSAKQTYEAQYKDVNCDDCKATWTEEYKLVHVDNVLTEDEQ